MRLRTLTTLQICALLLLTCLGAALPGHAASKVNTTPDPSPETVRTAAGLTEVGTLSAVPYRIDIPAAWNRGVVVYFHGYAEGPFTYRVTAPLTEMTQPFFDRGYAVIQSGYSAPGWALGEAYPETEQLRLYFVKRYGKAEKKDTRAMEMIVAGTSMGGALVTAELELNPKPFVGGLDLCGAVGSTDLAFQRRFAWRAAFDFYFPGLMPTLVPTPVDYQESRTLRQRLVDAMKLNPAAASAMRNLTALHTDHEVAEAISYYTYVIGDLQRRAGGNPFDNRNTIYVGTSPGSSVGDGVLNDGVRRYAGDARARDYLLRHYTPSGRLTHPMLALHTLYDPRVPANTLAIYNEQVALAGFTQNYVQQFVRRDGHCTFTADEIGRSFDELTSWIHLGRRPAGGALPAARPAPTATSALRPGHGPAQQ